MRYIFLLLFSFFLQLSVTEAQTDRMQRFQNMDVENLDPDEIPSPETLRKLGFSEEEIRDIQLLKRELQSRDRGSVPRANTTPGTPVTTPQDTLRKKIPADTLSTRKKDTVSVSPKYPPARVYGQEFFRNSNLKFYSKAETARAPSNYILGPGDEVSVSIWGYSDYSETFEIQDNGAIHPRLVGRIYLKGLSFDEARSLIRQRFGQVYDLNNSKIDITLAYSRAITVNIVGEVFNPGSYTIPAINTAFNALIAVGGPTNIGSVRNIYIKRAGKTIKRLDVYQFLLDPNSDQDFFLQDNDYIFVPPAEKIIGAVGEVKRPHNYELTEQEGLRELIKYAGGFAPTAYTSRIQVKRFSGNKEILIDVNFDSLLIKENTFSLYNGDEVLVRRIPDVLESFIEIQGAVRLPGGYELEEGDRVSDVLTKAEGVTKNAFLGRAFIIRIKEDLSKEYIPFNLQTVLTNPASADNRQLEEYDVIRIFSKEEFKDEHTVEIFGAVRNPGVFIFGEGMSLKDALYLAGGLQKEAANNRIEISRIVNFDEAANQATPTRTIVETVEISDDLTLEEGEFKLQPYDHIFVRSNPDFQLQQNVVVMGEVQFPGVYTILNENERLWDVIHRAGGLTEYAFAEGATLYRPEDNAGYVILDLPRAMQKPDSRYNYVLKEGDTIHIPEVKDLVAMGGAIEYPGIDTIGRINAPFHKGKSAGYYIREYGVGFKENAKKSRTYVEQPGGKVDGTVSLGIIKFYPKVEKGGKIRVPYKDKKIEVEKEHIPFDWNNLVDKVTAAAVAVAPIAVVYLLQKDRTEPK